MSEEKWSSILRAIGSPLKFFGLVTLVTSSVFAIAAGIGNNADAFIYSIHMFMGIFGFFVAIALWSPKSLYHPKELDDLTEKSRDELESRPEAVTAIGVSVLLLYMAYRIVILCIENGKVS